MSKISDLKMKCISLNLIIALNSERVLHTKDWLSQDKEKGRIEMKLDEERDIDLWEQVIANAIAPIWNSGFNP